MNIEPRFDSTWIREMKRLEQKHRINGQNRRRICEVYKKAIRFGRGKPLLEHLNVTKEISQEVIAQSIGVTRTAVVHWCSGREAPTFENLKRLEAEFASVLSDWERPQEEDLLLGAELEALRYVVGRQPGAIPETTLSRARLQQIRRLYQKPFSCNSGATTLRDKTDQMFGEFYLIVAYAMHGGINE